MKKQIKFTSLNNISSLDELAKYDQLFRDYTNGFVTDKSIADDVVQDMYLKLSKAFENGKVVNGGYIVITLKNLYLNHLKIVDRYNKGDETSEYVPQEKVDDFDKVLEDKLEEEKQYQLIEEKIDKLSWFEKSIIQFEMKMSLYQLSKKSGISYRSLIYSKNKINNKLGITNNKNK